MKNVNVNQRTKTAILVDGGFYRRRAQAIFGDKSACDRATELERYCLRHLNTHGESSNLYRIYAYSEHHTKEEWYVTIII